jgi:hypothetical protein
MEKNKEPPRIYPERLFAFNPLTLPLQLLRETRTVERDQWVKLTLMPVEKIMSLDFVPAIGGSVT